MFQLNSDSTQLLRLEDGASIPLALGNRDFNLAFELLKEKSLVVENADGTFTFSPDGEFLLEFPKEDLTVCKQRLSDRIDELAGDVRATYITTAKGQEATYTQKAAEFTAFVLDGSPKVLEADELGLPYFVGSNDVRFYYVAAEAQALGFDLEDISDADLKTTTDNVLLTLAAWTPIDARIESIRLGGKSKVNVATTHETINAAFELVNTQLTALRKPS